MTLGWRASMEGVVELSEVGVDGSVVGGVSSSSGVTVVVRCLP